MSQGRPEAVDSNSITWLPPLPSPNLELLKIQSLSLLSTPSVNQSLALCSSKEECQSQTLRSTKLKRSTLLWESEHHNKASCRWLPVVPGICILQSNQVVRISPRPHWLDQSCVWRQINKPQIESSKIRVCFAQNVCPSCGYQNIFFRTKLGLCERRLEACKQLSEHRRLEACKLLSEHRRLEAGKQLSEHRRQEAGKQLSEEAFNFSAQEGTQPVISAQWVFSDSVHPRDCSFSSGVHNSLSVSQCAWWHTTFTTALRRQEQVDL